MYALAVLGTSAVQVPRRACGMLYLTNIRASSQAPYWIRTCGRHCHPGITALSKPFMQLQVLEGHGEAVLALAVGDTFLVSGSYDTTVRFWALDSLRCIR